MTLPKIDDEQRASMFNRGNQYRRMGEFDRAVSVYEQIIREDNNDAEAHWCCALSRFGIEYVEDPNTFEWIPTCHRLSFDSFLEDLDYLAAIDNSNGITKKAYMRDAAKIVEVQKGILKTSQNEEPFDIFICYKETDDNGERTVDSVLAQDIYYRLTDKGYRVFFSKITLEDKVGTEFEPYIFAALNSAKVMIVIGTKKEYLNAVWVKNEWSRYLSIMRKNHDRVILPCYKDMDPYDMPEALSVLQSYDMSKIGFVQDLLRGIGKIIDEKDNHNSLDKGGVVQTPSVEPLTKRIEMFLEDGDFSKADEFCENVLNIDPENSKAYLYKVMALEEVKNDQELAEKGVRIQNDSNFIRSLRFADQEEKSRLENIIKSSGEIENERIYQHACEFENCINDLEKLCEAYCMFEKLDGYKDSEERKTTLDNIYIKTGYAEAVSKYKNAKTYSDMNEVYPVFKALSICYPAAKEYVTQIEDYNNNWKGTLLRLIDEEDHYNNSKDMVEQIKKTCPSLLGSKEHEDFIKKLDQYVEIERLYGNTKNSLIKLCKEYCSSVIDRP